MKKFGAWIMKWILKPIGRFFAAIWRWIKNTAWVQPLLIVGVIFAVIFSIPPIVSAIRNRGNDENAELYFRDRELKFDGLTKDVDSVEKSNVGKFAVSLGKALEQVNNGDLAAARTTMSQYGEKFFLSFVQTGCDSCKNMMKALELIQNGGIDNPPSIRLHAIFVDTLLEDEKGFRDDSPFMTLLDNSPLQSAFEQAAEVAVERPYYVNISGGATATYEANIDKMISADKTLFQTPTTILFDFTDASLTKMTSGVAEVMFSVDLKGVGAGSEDVRRAETIIDCW
ncbi:MAG: hypothetical protein LBR37_02180, partial [Erysipelotrichaceae bacterium]|nr:hypothetical protein [Erysipelotrichaceae bacterium]